MAALLVLVADPATAPLDRHLVDELAGMCRGTRRELAPDEAYEIGSEAADPAILRELIAPRLAELPLDWTVLPPMAGPKRLLLSDMDSTMITIECIDELAAELGIRDEIAAVTRRMMNGELDFVTALRERVALLEGLETAVIDAICTERVQVSPGAATLVATMRALGAHTVLVSGGFTPFTRYVRQQLGFHLDEGNELEIRDGRLTGRVVEPIRDAGAKLASLERLVAELGIRDTDVLALGDGANDLPMLHAAGLGIAYRAQPRVRAQVLHRIDHTPLTTALFYQGIPRRAFVEPQAARARSRMK
jgi:phosphoserine phosphatase